MYDNIDIGHNVKNHILPVTRDSLKLASNLQNININVVYVVASLHDIGLLIGRENHHISSKNYVLNDRNLRKWFNDNEIQTIAEAVLDHRGHIEPRSIYGKIISDADKSVDLHEILLRTHFGIKSKYPNQNFNTFDKEFEAAYNWILEKDSQNGYIKFYIDEDKQKKLYELQELIKDKDYIRKEYYKIYSLGEENNEN